MFGFRLRRRRGLLRSLQFAGGAGIAQRIEARTDAPFAGPAPHPRPTVRRGSGLGFVSAWRLVARSPYLALSVERDGQPPGTAETGWSPTRRQWPAADLHFVRRSRASGCIMDCAARENPQWSRASLMPSRNFVFLRLVLGAALVGCGPEATSPQSAAGITRVVPVATAAEWCPFADTSADSSNVRPCRLRTQIPMTAHNPAQRADTTTWRRLQGRMVEPDSTRSPRDSTE
jgi:hypothetical protein